MAHASFNIFNTDSLIAGLRALPDFSLSMARLSSAASFDLSMPKCRAMSAKSAPEASSSFIK